MDVHLSPDLESKLTRLAIRQGTDTEALVREALERLVDHDEWFRAEVHTGLAQIAAGNTISHDEAGKQLEAHLATRQRPA